MGCHLLLHHEKSRFENQALHFYAALHRPTCFKLITYRLSGRKAPSDCSKKAFSFQATYSGGRKTGFALDFFHHGYEAAAILDISVV